MEVLRIPAFRRPKAKNFPNEIDDITDKEFLNRIPRLCDFGDPHCHVSVVSLFLTRQQRRGRV
jgi:hypothetical protein